MRAMQIIEWGKPLEPRDYPTPEPTGEPVLASGPGSSRTRRADASIALASASSTSVFS